MQDMLRHLSNEELVQRILELQEELQMSRAFTSLPEPAGTDAILQWQGRGRFLAERVMPVRLEAIRDLSLNPDSSSHRIIEGDNLSVMTSLLTEFRGGLYKGIDVIYMDPPYNTGKDVFSYSDNYRLTKSEVSAIRRTMSRSESLVSLDDPSRHTKWINHIAPRIWAARKLLKSTGVLIISIDEHELPRLWMLLEETFGEKNRIATLVWERSRKNDATFVSEGHEYMLVWARNREALEAKVNQMSQTPEWSRQKGKWRKRKDGVDRVLMAYAAAKAQHGDDISKIQCAMDAFFADLSPSDPARKIRYRKVNHRGLYNDDGNPNWPGGSGPRYDVIHPVTGKPCKVPASGWRYTLEEMNRLIAENRVAFKADHTGIPRIITYLEEMENEVRSSVIRKSGQRAVEVVESILGKGAFKNPKDHEMLAELFNLVTWRDKQAVILDPYAGSGTSAHAVLSMNAEDQGNRRFILIESGVPSSSAKASRAQFTTDITVERVRRVITGQRADGSTEMAYQSGFTFYRARGQITKRAIMASTRENLADIILQVVEDDSNRVDCRVDGYRYLIGRTRTGYGIALVWEPNQGSKEGQTLTWAALERTLDEAESAGALMPVHIYACANSAPLSDDLYRFHQIPNSILARLGILDGDGEDDE